MAMSKPVARQDLSLLNDWRPEDATFWSGPGKAIAWRTLAITTFCLTLSFATWFAMSAIIVRMPNIGFKFSTMELFWLAAMPGLAGGTLRILHMFLIPIFGTRKVIAVATLLKLLPCIGIGFAVMNPATPYWAFLLLAFSAGFGGGDFSSFMPSTSLFFPKRLQGTALALQAGIGNFGVSLTQFVTPWIIGFAVFGALGGTPQEFVKESVTKPIWVQNAMFIYVPLLLFGAILAWAFLKSVPVRASIREQLDIFDSKHTWIMTSLYVMTFGAFSGFSAVFPMLIKTVYGKFQGAPDPLAYAFLGPLIGSIMRVVAGPMTDKVGGGILTTISGIGMFVSALFVAGCVEPTSLETFPHFLMGMLGIFFFSGIGNASTFRQIPIIFSHSPRQGAGVIGWTAAVAAYGPFVFSVLVGAVIGRFGSPQVFFQGVAAFVALNILLNWWFYARRGAERPC